MSSPPPSSLPLKDRLKRVARNVLILPRRVRAKRRMAPEFVIIGAQRCGTSYLYELLVRHPRILPSRFKEVHYFDYNYQRGWNWYLAHFPHPQTTLVGESTITGEGSPYYIFHPHSARRLRRDLPDAKLIVLLREPVARAYSHYNLARHYGREKLTFREALDAETTRVGEEYSTLLRNESYYAFHHHHHTYLGRGHYADQLERWLELFPREQFLFLDAKQLFTDPAETVRETFSFLGVQPGIEVELEGEESYPKYEPLDDGLRERLLEHYRPHNARLRKLLDVDWSWLEDVPTPEPQKARTASEEAPS